MAKTYTTLKNVEDTENWVQDEEAIFMEDLAAVYTYVEEQIR